MEDTDAVILREEKMPELQGWFYLHENNEVIYKNSPDVIEDIRDADLARKLGYSGGKMWNATFADLVKPKGQNNE